MKRMIEIINAYEIFACLLKLGGGGGGGRGEGKIEEKIYF